MTDAIAIQPLAPFEARVRPPGSKSLTNRALLLAALAEGDSTLHGPLLADDSQRMLEALRTLGFRLDLTPDGSAVRVRGEGGTIPRGDGSVSLHLGNAGTAYRFLTAACPLGAGRCVLDGVPRMRERPIAQLVEALHELGGRVRYLGVSGFPPVEVEGGGLTGGGLTMPPALSSQYLSALLHVGPYCRDGLSLRFDGPITSRPYVEMTLALMARFGIEAAADAAFTRLDLRPGRYRGTDYAIEPDASNASYFLAAAAIVPGSRCTVEGLGRDSLQGDVGFAEVLGRMGAEVEYARDAITVAAPPAGEGSWGFRGLRGIDADLNAMPDMAQTLAAVALFADRPTVIRNVGNLRVKETDRLAALRQELTKVGAGVHIEGDDLTIEPPAAIRPAAIDTYDDHRMAMSFAVVGLAAPGVVINDPACVNKTYPGFFRDLARLGRPR